MDALRRGVGEAGRSRADILSWGCIFKKFYSFLGNFSTVFPEMIPGLTPLEFKFPTSTANRRGSIIHTTKSNFTELLMKNLMGITLISALVLFTFTVSLTHQSAAQTKNPKTDELTSQSEVIVVGKVNTLKSEWTADKSRIQTAVTIAVDETMKGSVDGGELTVVIPGGEVDGVGEWYSHSAGFKTDEEVVVFAVKDKTGKYRVTSGDRGKYLVERDAETGSRIIPNVGSLNEFTARIKKNVKAQQAVGKDD